MEQFIYCSTLLFFLVPISLQLTIDFDKTIIDGNTINLSFQNSTSSDVIQINKGKDYYSSQLNSSNISIPISSTYFLEFNHQYYYTYLTTLNIWNKNFITMIPLEIICSETLSFTNESIQIYSQDIQINTDLLIIDFQTNDLNLVTGFIRLMTLTPQPYEISDLMPVSTDEYNFQIQFIEEINTNYSYVQFFNLTLDYFPGAYKVEPFQFYFRIRNMNQHVNMGLMIFDFSYLAPQVEFGEEIYVNMTCDNDGNLTNIDICFESNFTEVTDFVLSDLYFDIVNSSTKDNFVVKEVYLFKNNKTTEKGSLVDFNMQIINNHILVKANLIEILSNGNHTIRFTANVQLQYIYNNIQIPNGNITLTSDLNIDLQTNSENSEGDIISEATKLNPLILIMAFSFIFN